MVHQSFSWKQCWQVDKILQMLSCLSDFHHRTHLCILWLNIWKRQSKILFFAEKVFLRWIYLQFYGSTHHKDAVVVYIPSELLGSSPDFLVNNLGLDCRGGIDQLRTQCLSICSAINFVTSCKRHLIVKLL